MREIVGVFFWFVFPPLRRAPTRPTAVPPADVKLVCPGLPSLCAWNMTSGPAALTVLVFCRCRPTGLIAPPPLCCPPFLPLNLFHRSRRSMRLLDAAVQAPALAFHTFFDAISPPCQTVRKEVRPFRKCLYPRYQNAFRYGFSGFAKFFSGLGDSGPPSDCSHV